MIVDLTETNASEIASTLIRVRRQAGSPAMGMVLTFIFVADESTYYDALKAAMQAGKEHPSRIIGIILRGGRGAAKLDAEVRIGEGGPGESVLLRMYGELAKHPESVVTPLLLPESPVVVWWPGKAPDAPSADPIGALARRRVTDAAAVRKPLTALDVYCGSYAPGDTDLAWTRLTPWRALLAAALDQHGGKVSGAVIEAEKQNASADLLAAWLSKRLKVEAEVRSTRGPGITAVRLATAAGEIAITRPDGRLARYSLPGQPERSVALKRRETSELLAEELRRLDPDDIYAQAVEERIKRAALPASNGRASAPAAEEPAKKAAPAKKASPAKKAPAKKTASKSTAKKAAKSTRKSTGKKSSR
jgi:glucose-6-phosphate dehydrogenase assembly protein OpcA